MSLRTFESTEIEAFPFPPPSSHYASPVTRGVDEDAAFESEAEPLKNDFPTASGCLRGFCWAIALETAGALCLFAAWHFRHTWR